MKISRRRIIMTAWELRNEKGTFTQFEIHEKIEEWLGRPLTPGEKIRITKILRGEFNVEKVERPAQKDYTRVIFFF